MALSPRELDRNTINCISFTVLVHASRVDHANMMTTPNNSVYANGFMQKHSSVTDHSPFVAFASQLVISPWF